MLIDVRDRVSREPNRRKITFEDNGEVRYATIEFADDPVVAGTPLNRTLFNQIDAGLKRYATGTYVGDGRAGITDPVPMQLSFDFAPTIIVIVATDSASFPGMLIPCGVLSADFESRKIMASGSDAIGFSPFVFGKKSADGKTVSWYSKVASPSTAGQQMNIDGETYRWMAVG